MSPVYLLAETLIGTLSAAVVSRLIFTLADLLAHTWRGAALCSAPLPTLMQNADGGQQWDDASWYRATRPAVRIVGGTVDEFAGTRPVLLRMADWWPPR